MKEWVPELLFECFNLLRDRRLRQQQLLSGPAETCVPGYSAKND
jgi:hypothetical protein